MTRIIVTAIRSREPFVFYLQRHIPDLEVVWDEKRNAMDTFLRATALAGDDAVIRLEDDICLSKGWREAVEAEIVLRPDNVINFFSRSKYDAEKGSHWRAGARFNYNLCYYTPKGFNAEILQFYPDWQARNPQHPTGYDLTMADLLSSKGENYWQTVPSLVNHAITISQIDRRRPRKRQSNTFINPELEGYPDESRFL